MFKKNDHVKYVGETWPERIGQKGVVVRYEPRPFREHGGYVTVLFDSALTVVYCYGKSLELIK